MKKFESTSNHRCSDAATFLTDGRPERPGPRPTVDDPTWFPPVVSSYALTESAHWSRRLDDDVKRGMAGVARRVAAVAAAGRDYYGREDADAAHLERRPASFAIFGKPGLPADSLADALSAYWGCVHVSAAAGLAAGRAGARAAWALRRGKAVTAAGTAAQLNAVLALADPVIRERGYVLTGFPRHDPKFSANAQIDAVFSVNPPDVLIYLSCPNQDLEDYHNGLILESTKHDRLKQMLHLDKQYSCNNHGYVRWYKSLRHKIIGKLSLEAYEQYTFKAVDEIVKQFDSEFVITVDGRRPVEMIFETIKAKLMVMHIQRTVLPKIIKNGDESSSVLSEHNTYRPGSETIEETYETEDMEEYKSESMETIVMRSAVNVHEINENDEQTNQVSVSERNEKIRLMSEFGQLCPVNFFYGLFKFGVENYCVQYMGKLYFFAGSEEIKLFCQFPKRFLEVPRTGLPIRAIFYGPETLSSTAAKAVSNFFGYNLIDVNNITHTYKEHEKRTYLSTVVKFLVKNAQEINKTKRFQASEIDTMRHAIGDWIRLYFENISSESLGESHESVNEMFEDYSDQRTINEHAKEEQLIILRNYFELYDIDFIDDFDACVHVYKEPLTLITYFQNKLNESKNALKADILNENKTTQLKLMDIIVDEVRIRNCKNKNWIIVNAPLDFLLVKKLITANLNPIQFVFFCDTDPMHKVLLTDNKSDEDRNRIIRETVESVRNGRRYETTVEQMNYLEYVKATDNTSNVYEDEYDHFDNEYEIEDSFEYASIYISHDRIMKMIMPEITERLNQYTRNLLEQWHTLKTFVSHETSNNYIDFNVIECNPDSATNMIKTLVEDTLHYVKKFLSDNVYDVSTTDPHDTVPDIGKYNGDTSIYCPVRFANGRLAIGSKKYMAVYQNRYYYMSSSDDLKAFTRDPRNYASFTSVPKLNPKPKISLLCPFGHSDKTGLTEYLLDAFDLILVDSHDIFVKKVLPKDIPMLGEMYEEPTLRKVIDKHFVPANRDKEYIDGLRRYMDRENEHLNHEDWMKMNSIFFHNDVGICYKNYPRNVTELMCLKENGMNPDVIVELTAGDHKKKENAKKAVLRNRLTYQNALIDVAVARDDTTRRNTAKNRSTLFRKKLAEVIQRQKTDDIRSRIRRTVEMVAVETAYGPGAIERVCNDGEPVGDAKSWRTTASGKDRPADFQSLCRRLTLRRKVMIVNHGLNAGDLLGLDDLTDLERIDEAVNDEHADDGLVASECFSDGMELPSDATVERHLAAERAAVTGMRRFAESAGVPWITDDGSAGSTALDAVAELLRVRAGDVPDTAYDVDVDASEDMLRAGEAYLSGYGRRCPVRANERPDSARTFHADRADGRVRPVVHRGYVYYVGGPEDRDKFVRRPSDYALRPSPAAACAPLRIAVLGPSGRRRSERARRLCDRHGFQLIRIEEAAGAHLTAYWWTDAGRSASLRLRRGGALSDVALADAVKSAAQSPRAVAQGYVIDGFPTTRQQFRLMDDAGVILHRVFVVDGPRRDDRDRVSALSRRRRAVYDEEFVGVPWISERYGNAAAVGGDDMDDDMDASIAACVRSLREYRADRRARRPCRLADVPVTQDERAHKMTAYLDTCPVCRTDDGVRNRPRDPAALRRTTVQYRSHFYWTCGEHGGAFAGHPDAYADRAPAEPEPLAEAADAVNAPPAAADQPCVVCALTRLWDPVYRRGRPSHAAEYGGRTFACCSAACLDEFVRRPVAYSRYKMRVAGPLLDDDDDDDGDDCGTPRISSGLDVARFPDLGYLEQTVGLPVGSALAELMVARPVYPGLSADVAAIVFLGLYVGATDAVVDRDIRRYYLDAFRKFYAACNDFKMVTFALKFIA